jgi:iron only hydrogenase large subunit-like protein
MHDRKNKVHFHHALAVMKDVCIGCTHCMTVCPTQAIRVRNGRAIIIANRCVDCGECYRACPVSAIKVEQDDIDMILGYKARVILIPSVLIGQFPRKISTSSIYKALRAIGFTHVFEVESSVDMVVNAGRQYMLENKERPMISSFCPAIIRLIQVKFPTLVDNIMRVSPPIDLTAKYYREKIKKGGIREDQIGVFYATPCAAKIAAVKSPVGEPNSAISGVININFLYNAILKFLTRRYTETDPPESDERLTSRGIRWSLTRGEVSHFSGRALAIDGIKNVNEFLENIENEKLDHIDFLELRACDEGCAGGILISGNRFLTVERLRNRADEYKAREEDKVLRLDEDYINLEKEGFFGPIEPRPMAKLDEDFSLAMKKMERKRRLMCYLPGFDCAACGAPDCQTLSEDIVKGDAQLSHCVFMQQQMIRQNLLDQDHAYRITENIWGTERLEKNCNKLGAEDENN